MTHKKPKDVVKVGVVPMEQDFEVVENSNGSISVAGGIEGRFIEMLSTYVGFKYELVIPPDEQWGVEKDDGSWTGIIEMVRRGEVDLGLGYLVITEARHRAVRFSTPYSIADKTFVTNPPKRLPIATAFISPFGMELWIACLVLLVVFPIVLSGVSSRRFLYLDVLFRIFGTFCKQPISVLEDSNQVRFAFGFWSIFVTVITLSYCGVLPSFLTIPLMEKGINSIHDLYEAAENGYIKCLAPEGSSELEVLFHSNQHDVKSIGRLIRENSWYYDLTNGTVAEHLQENSALIGLRLWFSSPDFAGKLLSTDSFGVWNVGIALKSNFCCVERLNVIILRVQAAGLFDKLVSDEFFETMLSVLSKTGGKSIDTTLALSLNDMRGPFMLLLFGHTAAFVSFIGELIFKVLQSKEYSVIRLR